MGWAPWSVSRTLRPDLPGEQGQQNWAGRGVNRALASRLGHLQEHCALARLEEAAPWPGSRTLRPGTLDTAPWPHAEDTMEASNCAAKLKRERGRKSRNEGTGEGRDGGERARRNGWGKKRVGRNGPGKPWPISPGGPGGPTLPAQRTRPKRTSNHTHTTHLTPRDLNHAHALVVHSQLYRTHAPHACVRRRRTTRMHHRAHAPHAHHGTRTTHTTHDRQQERKTKTETTRRSIRHAATPTKQATRPSIQHNSQPPRHPSSREWSKGRAQKQRMASLHLRVVRLHSKGCGW